VVRMSTASSDGFRRNDKTVVLPHASEIDSNKGLCDVVVIVFVRNWGCSSQLWRAAYFDYFATRQLCIDMKLASTQCIFKQILYTYVWLRCGGLRPSTAP
jgi:hypothetical protein